MFCEQYRETDHQIGMFAKSSWQSLDLSRKRRSANRKRLERSQNHNYDRRCRRTVGAHV
jgi:hypothetical protein